MKPETRRRLVRSWKAFYRSYSDMWRWDDEPWPTEWTERISRAHLRLRSSTLAIRYCQRLYIDLGIDALTVNRDLLAELHPINIATATREELEEDGFIIDDARQAELKAGGYLT